MNRILLFLLLSTPTWELSAQNSKTWNDNIAFLTQNIGKFDMDKMITHTNGKKSIVTKSYMIEDDMIHFFEVYTHLFDMPNSEKLLRGDLRKLKKAILWKNPEGGTWEHQLILTFEKGGLSQKYEDGKTSTYGLEEIAIGFCTKLDYTVAKSGCQENKYTIDDPFPKKMNAAFDKLISEKTQIKFSMPPPMIDFLKSKNNWEVHENGRYSRRYEDKGTLFIIADTTLLVTPKNKLTIDTDRNFEIETSLTYMGGPKDSYLYFVWGMNEAGDQKRFGITPNGDVWIAKKPADGEVKSRFKKTDVVNFREGQLIKLTVKKQGRTISYYLNGDVVLRAQDSQIYGYQAGLIIPSKMNVKIDYIEINYLD